MSIWDSLFAHMNQPVAQILLTRENIADASQYNNAKSTLSELLNFGVIPIINENDTLAVAEIKFGDNDTLSAISSAMVNADYLFLMTDVDCLYDKNPRKFPDAQPILVVEDIDALQADVSSAGSALGTGGMATKIVAARLATSAGTTTIITKSSKPGHISDIIRYLHPTGDSTNGTASTTGSLTTTTPPLHTRFISSTSPIRSRAFWILHGLAPHGIIYIDRGAFAALSAKSNLLPIGIVDVSGTFAQQEAVRLVVVDKVALGALSPSSDNRPSSHLIEKGDEVGRAVVNFSSAEVARIKGLRSSEIKDVLGYADSEYVAYRENVSLKSRESRPQTPAGEMTPEGSVADLRIAQ